jgi:hypothetical protein
MQPTWLSQSEWFRVEVVKARREDSTRGDCDAHDRPVEQRCRAWRGWLSGGGAALAGELGASAGVGAWSDNLCKAGRSEGRGRGPEGRRCWGGGGLS